MIETSENFTAWACAPGRTLEERFGAQKLIEQTHNLWRKKHDIELDFNFEADRLRDKARSLDPGYVPSYERADTNHVDEILGDLKTLHLSHYADRPLRDISFLRFCTELETLDIQHTEIADWSPLGALQKLTQLHIWENKSADLRVLGEIRSLRELRMYLYPPWPDLRGLERLENLTSLFFHGNILALNEVPYLPAVRVVDLGKTHTAALPLRNVAGLPVMPELRNLKLESTCALDGIERYENLINLEVHGLFSDLAPLASLRQLTHVTLHNGDYPGLQPLAGLPDLRKVTLHIEFPPDLTPLVEVPRLHEIKLESPVIPAELETLNSLCTPWSEEFEMKPARPLDPVRLRVLSRDDHRTHDGDHTALPREWGDDAEMGKSEIRWFCNKLHRRLTRLLGKGWGKKSSDNVPGHPGHNAICITRMEDIDRLPEIVATFRQLVASTRHPWKCVLMVDSLARYELDFEEIQRDPETYDPEQDRMEWEEYFQKKRERRDFLQRKYRHQLSEETGVPIPPPEPVLPAACAPQDEEGQAFEETEIPDHEYDLGTSLNLYATLTEKSIFIWPHQREQAEMLFEMKAEES